LFYDLNIDKEEDKDMAHTASHGNNTNAFGMVMIGAMAGALAALLFAPKKGTEMRDDIKDRYTDVMTKSQDTMTTARDKMRTATDRFRSKTHDMADDAKDMADDMAESAKDAVDKTADKTDRMMDETATSTRNSRKSM
jgi:gas vesicle protein